MTRTETSSPEPVLDTTENGARPAGPASPPGGAALVIRPLGESHARRRRVLQRVLTVASPLSMLLLWELAVAVDLLDERFFPPPSTIADTFVEMVGNGELMEALKVSVGRLVVGFFMGAIPGLLLGLTMGLFLWPRVVLKPLVSALYPIPKTSILPLILLIFGLGEMSQYVIIASGVFFLIAVNTMVGVLTIPEAYLDVGRSFQVSSLNRFRTIALPGALPHVFSGAQLGLGLGIALLVVGEMLSARSGLGYLIWSSWQRFDVSEMYVGLIAISVLGILSQIGLDLVQRIVTPWSRT